MDTFLKADPVPCVIDGKPHQTSKTYDVVDPHKPSQVLHKIHCATQSDVDAALASSARAYATWRHTSAMHRRGIFLKVASLIRQHSQALADIEVRETTGAEGWAKFGQFLTADAVDELAGVVTSALRGELATTMVPDKTAMVLREPYGVVLGIAPWNAPLILSMRSVANAIIAGNTAILKTSEYSPRTHMIVPALFAEAGLPPGVLNVLHISTADAPSLVEHMIKSPQVAKLNFTGSTPVGSKIAELCGRHLKPCVMELGGKAPAVVMPDADLELAANNITYGFTFHQGQICMATNTAIVHKSIRRPFLAALRAVLPRPASPPRGLFSRASAERSSSIVHDALSKGAIASGGYEGPKGEGGNVVDPTVLDGVKEGMRIWEEEMFSPVLGVVEYGTVQEAVEIANGHEYGLAASVFSKDHAAALEVAKQIQAGMVHINGPTIHDLAQMPHGGMKKSGWGRFNGVEGIDEFTQTKVITVYKGAMKSLEY